MNLRGKTKFLVTNLLSSYCYQTHKSQLLFTGCKAFRSLVKVQIHLFLQAMYFITRTICGLSSECKRQTLDKTFSSFAHNPPCILYV
jgi:hypothetical protein